MDEGTDAREVLENKLLPLRRGETMIIPQFYGPGVHDWDLKMSSFLKRAWICQDAIL